ncbi:MarR family winged helix-turn-helix transcriptional regulator [Nocardioides yefusunii]|uniref:MarR family winged helix-turn-helix transcriptional regulator n=1 Tax=Nocardioides yefusunii TaxID=2500546 RepID=A0ABW1QSG4_9ACTN|nr:MarR family transcriptional regulator [Nocardioides yefusunii]
MHPADDVSLDPLPVWRALVVAHDTTMRAFAAAFKEHRLTVSQYDVLLRLLQNRPDPIPMGDLAAALLYSSGAATKVVDRLEALGHVRRSRAIHDKRVVLVELTQAGLEVAATAARRHAADVRRIVGELASPEEAAHVTAFLERLTLRAAADSTS